MTLRPILFVVTLALFAVGTPAMARPAHRASAPGRTPTPPDHAIAAPARVQAVRPVAAGSSAMIAQTGAARRSVAVRAATGNGIAGGDFARPAARAMVGGGLVVSGGIDGGTVHRRH